MIINQKIIVAISDISLLSLKFSELTPNLPFQGLCDFKINFDFSFGKMKYLVNLNKQYFDPATLIAFTMQSIFRPYYNTFLRLISEKTKTSFYVSVERNILICYTAKTFSDSIYRPWFPNNKS